MPKAPRKPQFPGLRFFYLVSHCALDAVVDPFEQVQLMEDRAIIPQRQKALHSSRVAA